MCQSANVRVDTWLAALLLAAIALLVLVVGTEMRVERVSGRKSKVMQAIESFFDGTEVEEE